MSQSRQLAAIMFTDIAGYTSSMGEDEQKAFELLRHNRQLQKPLIEQYGGKWIKEMGDGILASFTTVTDAVLCAITIQEASIHIPGLKLRIGIHLGEVIFENDDVFGDGVNIASRIQALAPIGGIWVSESVHNNISNKKEIESRFVKEEVLKNVKGRVRIYEIKLKYKQGSELHPNAESGSDNASKIGGKKPSGKRLLVFIFLFAVLLISVYLIYNRYNKPVNRSTLSNNAEVLDKSIAVLPFVNLSNDKNQEYLSDGLSEELLNMLARIPDLKVIGRTSSFSFKGKSDDILSISRKLGVGHILEGSVRKEGNRIRVNAQLVSGPDGVQLWSDTYEVQMEGIFKLQDTIAREIVKNLKLKLLPVSNSGTSSPLNIKVYNLILQGNYLAEKRDKLNLAKALDVYLEALALDSTNARVWTAMAKCYNLQSNWGWIEQTGYEKARFAANKALALDNKQAEAHMVLGAVKMHFDFDWNGADEEYKKALALEPGNSDVLRIMGYLARIIGQLDKSIKLIKQSINVDPIKGIAHFNFGQTLFYANRYDEAIISFKKLLDLNPQFPRTHTFLGEVYLFQGKSELALDEMHKEVDEGWKGFGLVLVYHHMGRKEEADEVTKDYIAKFQKTQMYQVAEIYAFRGEKDKAFEWLDKAFTGTRDGRLTYIKGDPLMKNLESDPRYKSFLKKMNLPLN